MTHPFERFDLPQFKVSCESDGRHITLIEDLRRELCRRVLDTEDRMVREALIKLGWSPPERTRELIDTLLRINCDVWPLVHGLTCRDTLRQFMRTLPDITTGDPHESPRGGFRN